MFGWDAAATLAAGGAAVAAAFWTLRDTRRSAWVNALEKKLAIARRTMAVLEVIIGDIDAVLKQPTRYSAIVPWNAFIALSGEIGALDIQQIRLFVFIESLARDAEAAAERNAEKTPSRDILLEMRKRCEPLRRSCAGLVGTLERQLSEYYKRPVFGRLPRPFKETNTPASEGDRREVPTRESPDLRWRLP